MLLVEDDEVDIMTISRVFKTLKITNPLVLAYNGEDALTHLRSAQTSRPCLILLDLNMPRMGGIEFLGIVKQDSNLRRIPVIVLTSSRAEQDLLASFDHSVAGYIVKPADHTQFVDVVKTIDLYWTLSELSGE